MKYSATLVFFRVTLLLAFDFIVLNKRFLNLTLDVSIGNFNFTHAIVTKNIQFLMKLHLSIKRSFIKPTINELFQRFYLTDLLKYLSEQQLNCISS